MARKSARTLSQLDPRLLKAAVYGANDGIITTFAVVAGVAGANLAVTIILILGVANLIADGVSMGFGDYLGERSEQRLRRNQRGAYRETGLWQSGLVTFVAFVVAGSLPLMPYLLATIGVIAIEQSMQFPFSIVSTGVALFVVGSARTLVTKGAWWKNGMEMLAIGAVAATVAYILGDLVEMMLM